MEQTKSFISKQCIFHFLPAKAGDCVVLELPNMDCIIVDCGYRSTYFTELKPLLLKLNAKGCRVSLMIITHMDQDHIEGAIAFIKDNGKASEPRIIPVDNIWFNGFFNTIFMRGQFDDRRNNAIGAEQNKKMKLVAANLIMQTDGEDGHISAVQSQSLEELCSLNGYNLNGQFSDKIVKKTGNSRDDIVGSSIFINGYKIAILGPSDKDIERLANRLNIELIKQFGENYVVTTSLEFARLFELLMGMHKPSMLVEEKKIAYTDSSLEAWLNTSNEAPMSEVNRASIVVEIEYDDERFLFTGDSDSEQWKNYLAESYHMIKASHHGTTKPNIGLLEKTTGKAILISTNGGSGNKHPEKDFLARTILSGNKKLYFNYDINQKDKLQTWQEEYGFSAIFREKSI